MDKKYIDDKLINSKNNNNNKNEMLIINWF